MEDGAKVGIHILKMIKLIEMTKSLDSCITNNMTISLVVTSLLKSYTKFVKDFYKEHNAESVNCVL